MSDGVAETSYAERARTLVHRGRVGALATLSRRIAGFPFGSVSPYGVDQRGQPILLISTLAMHTQNLTADNRASLLVQEEATAEEALAMGRVTLVGRAQPVASDETPVVRSEYLERHPAAQAWVGMKDFAFYRLAVTDAYYVGGFGAMGWISADDYHTAAVDPLADSIEGIVEHMNADHGDAVLLYARVLAGLDADTAVMTGVDRLGFRLRAGKGTESRTVRLAFPSEIRSTDEARQALIAMLKTARQRQ